MCRRLKAVFRVLSVAALASLLIACAPSAAVTSSPAPTALISASPSVAATQPATPARTPAPTTAGFNCPVTVANASTPPDEAFSKQNHGNGKIWTVLWQNETVMIPPENIDENGILWMKFPWWRGPGVSGTLHVVGQRLDATSAPLQFQMSDYGPTGFQASGLGFASGGCWQVTGSAGSAELTFVTRVALVG
jgi:hypothetical protein